MEKTINLIIKVMLINFILNNIFQYSYLFSNSYRFLNGINKLHFIVPFFLSFLLFFILWIYSKKISKNIIGTNNEYQINLNNDELINIVIIAICLYYIIFNISNLIISVTNFVLLYTKNLNKDMLNENIKRIIVNIFASIIEIIISISLILFRKEIINKLK